MGLPPAWPLANTDYTPIRRPLTLTMCPSACSPSDLLLLGVQEVSALPATNLSAIQCTMSDICRPESSPTTRKRNHYARLPTAGSFRSLQCRLGRVRVDQ